MKNDTWPAGGFHFSRADFGRATDVWLKREDGVLVGGRFDLIITAADKQKAMAQLKKEAGKIGPVPPGMTRYRIITDRDRELAEAEREAEAEAGDAVD